jgi:hypothetical protein
MWILRIGDNQFQSGWWELLNYMCFVLKFCKNTIYIKISPAFSGIQSRVQCQPKDFFCPIMLTAIDASIKMIESTDPHIAQNYCKQLGCENE